MNITPFAQGLSTIGRYVLGRKQEQQAAQQRLTLETMKNEMWNKRLQEETERQKIYQQRLENQYKLNLEAQAAKEAKERERDLFEKELKYKYDLQTKQEQREYERPFKETQQKYQEAQIKFLGTKGVNLTEKTKKLSEEETTPYHLTPKGTDLTLKYMDRAEKFSKDYQTVNNNLMNIVASIDRLQSMPEDEENRIAVNQAIITSFNKITDPTSVVRESEYKRTPQGSALIERLKGAYENIQKGGQLTPKNLIEIKETAKEIAEIRRRILNEKLEQQIREPARKRQLDPEEIAPLYEAIEEQEEQEEDVDNEIDINYKDEDIDKHLDNLIGKQRGSGRSY